MGEPKIPILREARENVSKILDENRQVGFWNFHRFAMIVILIQFTVLNPRPYSYPTATT